MKTSCSAAAASTINRIFNVGSCSRRFSILFACINSERFDGYPCLSLAQDTQTRTHTHLTPRNHTLWRIHFIWMHTFIFRFTNCAFCKTTTRATTILVFTYIVYILYWYIPICKQFAHVIHRFVRSVPYKHAHRVVFDTNKTTTWRSQLDTKINFEILCKTKRLLVII